MPSSRSKPDTDALAALSGRRLQKAPAGDTVAAVGSPRAEPGRRRPAVESAAAKVKNGYYQSADDIARARAAYSWTHNQEGHRSFSDFIAAAVMTEVERLEKVYNDGRPWEPVGAGEIPTGRPFSE